jgi:uncharacterized protein (UPF0216 family)
MSSELERALRRYVERVYMDKRFFESLLPKRYVKLVDIVNSDRPYVELLSGEKHYFNIEEVRDLYRSLPWYLRSFALLPWVFTYNSRSFTPEYVLLNNDPWTPRILNFILNGSIAKTVTRVKSSDFQKLLSRFKTLIIVVLNIEVLGGGEGEGFSEYEA